MRTNQSIGCPEYTVMKKFLSSFVSIFAVIAAQVAIAPASYAQIQGSVTHITPVPDGAYFSVDGQSYSHAASAVWPIGSKHTLFVGDTIQNSISKTRLTFQAWKFAGGTLPTNPVVVTADASIGDYQAIFNVEYALSVVFFNCPDSNPCAGPGTIYVGTAPITSTTDIYIGAGGSVTLQAIPNPGFVFVGWQPLPGQAITGFQNIVTLNGPTQVYPKFQVARQINVTIF